MTITLFLPKGKKNPNFANMAFEIGCHGNIMSREQPIVTPNCLYINDRKSLTIVALGAKNL